MAAMIEDKLVQKLRRQRECQRAAKFRQLKCEFVQETKREEKLRQAAKIRQLREVLCASGYTTIREQAAVLGLKTSTTWAIFHSEHTHGGLSGRTIKQLLAARSIPVQVEKVVREYITEKLSGAYGHQQYLLKGFRLRAGFDVGNVARPKKVNREKTTIRLGQSP
jgi:hypothetical protein